MSFCPSEGPPKRTPFTVAEVRRRLIKRLKDAGIENHVQEADFMMCRLLNCTRAFILAHPEKSLTYDEHAIADRYALRRISGEPLQYVLNEAFFWGRPFVVGEGVLIPRPETELLVELALEFIPDEPLTFLDWGTGSGCIAVSLLLERPQTRAIGAEKNPRSIPWAWKNIRRYSLYSRYLLWHSRTPRDIPLSRGECRFIVSNPPYIPSGEIPELMRVVRDYEPSLALDGGECGMDCYKGLFQAAPYWLPPGGMLFFEIGGAEQSAAMKNWNLSSFVLVKEIADYAGIPRCMAWRYQPRV